MDAGPWLMIGLAGLALIPAIWLLDRLGLWLEDRGWLYYRRKRPHSSAMSAWVALQQFIEPSVKHVVRVGEARPHADDEAVNRERILANLLASFEAPSINSDEIRVYLVMAKRAGLDWKELYDEAARIQRAAQPDRAARIPAIKDVAPLE